MDRWIAEQQRQKSQPQAQKEHYADDLAGVS
jgi:hypothetical protein